VPVEIGSDIEMLVAFGNGLVCAKLDELNLYVLSVWRDRLQGKREKERG
jgi:hypothetical protein